MKELLIRYEAVSPSPLCDTDHLALLGMETTSDGIYHTMQSSLNRGNYEASDSDELA